MEVVFDIYLKGLRKYVYRKVSFSSSLSLQHFCEYVIFSMNGTCRKLYKLVLEDDFTYLGPGWSLDKSDTYSKMMDDLTLSDISISVSDSFVLSYDLDWDFVIKVNKIKDETDNRDFRVLDGYGTGILENEHYGLSIFKDFYKGKLDPSEKRFLDSMIPEFSHFQVNQFDIEKINSKMEEMMHNYLECIRSRHYTFSITLEGFTKIRRKVVVNNNLSLDAFCRGVVLSMGGDLSHPYSAMRNGEYLNDDLVLYYLELKENQRINVIYDYGDSWRFNLKLAKIELGYSEKSFHVISGKSHGIIDDCGGVFGLVSIFDKDPARLEEFDLDLVNTIIEERI